MAAVFFMPPNTGFPQTAPLGPSRFEAEFLFFSSFLWGRGGRLVVVA